MPAKSAAQMRMMRGVAHSPEFAAKVGIPQSVGREFMEAGMMKRQGGMMQGGNMMMGQKEKMMMPRKDMMMDEPDEKKRKVKKIADALKRR